MGSRNPNANSNNYLEGTPCVTAAPFSFAAWVYPTSDASDNWVMLLSASGGTTDNYWRLGLAGSAVGDPVRFYAFAGSAALCSTSTSFVANKWQRVCCVERGAADRSVYLDGGGKGSNASSRAPAGVNNLRIARYASGNSFTGKIGPFRFWNVGLTDDEVAMDAKGILVRPSAMIDYQMDNLQKGVERDVSRRFPLTVVGTMDRGDGPPLVQQVGHNGKTRRKYFVGGTPPPPPSGQSKANIIAWLHTNGTTVLPPPPPPPPPPSGQRILWDDPRILHRQSADRPFSEHDSNLVVIGPNTVIGSAYRMNQIPPEGLIMTPATPRNMLSRVFADPANEGVARWWFRSAISNNCPVYMPQSATQNVNTIRIGVGGPYTTLMQPGLDIWQVGTLVFHDNMCKNMGAPSPSDNPFSGIHHDNRSGITKTTMTMFGDPPNSSGINLFWRSRRWNPPDKLNPTGDSDGWSINHTIKNGAVPFRAYTIVTHWRYGWTEAHDPIHECWVREAGVWLQNGQPVYSSNCQVPGAATGVRGLGYNLDASHFPGIDTRVIGNLYNWRNATKTGIAIPADAWPSVANGAEIGFPDGDRCWTCWYRGGVVMFGRDEPGRAPVNHLTLAATMDSTF